MTKTSKVENAASLALVVTLVYTTCGFSIQSWRILTTGETPSLALMILAACTFASWSYWAWISTPKIWKVGICNTVGLGGSILVIVLTLRANAARNLEHAKGAVTVVAFDEPVQQDEEVQP